MRYLCTVAHTDTLSIDTPDMLALLQRLPMAAACVDLQGAVTYLNPVAIEESGYTRDDVPTMTAWRERAFPDPAYRSMVAARWDAAVARAAESGASGGRGDIEQVDVRVLTRYGEKRDASIFGLALRGGILAFFIDHTERNRAEALRRLVEQRFRDIVEATGEYVWECDAESRYVYLSDKVRDIFGWTPDEMLGRRPSDFMPPGEPAEVDARIARLREPSRAFRGLEHRSLKRSGEEIWQLVSSVPILDERGQIVGFRGTGRDITARKQAEADRDRLELQMRQAQKLQALGTFAGGVAHEFNNLLAVILGHTALARGDPALPAATREHLQSIEEAACDARGLVLQLLAVGRQQPRSIARIPLAPLVRDCLRLFEASLPENVSLGFVAPEHDLYVACDPAQIRQVLLNLGLNAMQAMQGRKGAVSVTLGESLLADGDATAAHLRPGRYARIEFADQGCGMDEATLARIFEPFFTTKPPGEGTGLGLSVVDGILHGHAGAVVAHSQPGRGSSFVVYLPLAEN